MKENMPGIFRILETNLQNVKSGTIFSLPSLYGQNNWDRLYIGDKVMAGNQFLRKVRQGEYPEIKELPKNSRQQQRHYQKR